MAQNDSGAIAPPRFSQSLGVTSFMAQGITKIEAAQRQLVTAIELFLREADPVSIFTLASNAWEVIDTLCTKKGIGSISNETREHITTGHDLKKDFINAPFRNFFKHADRDPEDVLKGFSDTQNDHIIFLAVEDYIRLNKKSPVEFQVYQLWYLSINTDKVLRKALEKILAATEVMFPSIKEKDRSAQKFMALKAIMDAHGDRELNNDPRVEEAYQRLFQPNA